MKRNFLQVLILFVFCTALYGDDYRLYLNRTDALIRLREWHSSSVRFCMHHGHHADVWLRLAPSVSDMTHYRI